MSKLYFGSLDFSKLLEQAKAGHQAFKKADNGKIYLNVNVWMNDQKDQYGNDASIQASYKDAPKEDKFYFGNLKESEFKEPVALEAGSSEVPEESDLPF